MDEQDDTGLGRPRRGFTGYFMPVELIEDKRLNWTERALVAEIHALGKGPMGCTASNRHFASQLDLSEQRVVDILTKLRKLGYVRTSGFDGRNRRLEVDLYAAADHLQTSGQTTRKQVGSPRENKSSCPGVTQDNKHKGKSNAPARDFADDGLQKEWETFAITRKQLHKPLTAIARDRILTKLRAWPVETATLALKQSNDNGWTGVFEPRPEQRRATAPTPWRARERRINQLNTRKAHLLRSEQTKEVERELVQIDIQLRKL